MSSNKGIPTGFLFSNYYSRSNPTIYLSHLAFVEIMNFYFGNLIMLVISLISNLSPESTHHITLIDCFGGKIAGIG